MIWGAENSQPCINCGGLVTDFHQWFIEDCPGHWAGHQVQDWTALKFTDAIALVKARLAESCSAD